METTAQCETSEFPEASAPKLADLVLLDGSPLQDIRNTQKIHAVVADGRLYRRADLDQLLVQVQKLKQH